MAPPPFTIARMLPPVGYHAEVQAASGHEHTLPATPAGDATPSPGMLASSSDQGASAERLAQIEEQEHRANIERFRRGLSLGFVMWLGFMSADLLADAFIQPGIGPWLVSIRIAIAPIILASVLALRRPGLSRRMVRIIELATFGAASLGIALMCVEFGGLTSPYTSGVVAVIVCHGAFISNHWRRGLVPALVIWLVHPVVVLASAAFSGAVRAQLQRPDALVHFGIHEAYLGLATALTLFAGHMLWTMRRQVFEARDIGGYRLERRIGAGGMGEVWSASHGTLKRRVAVKILRSDRGLAPAAVRRFEREIVATTRLQHPNTVRVYDYGTTSDGLWYYVMELLEGQHLAALVARTGPLTSARAGRLLVQAARAIAEAHDKGILHRDLKPENLFVLDAGGERDFVKVLDFGIAKLGDEAGATLTQDGWVGGTPAFMSPEAAAGRPTDARSDVYALGAVLYFALVGRAPFEGSSVAELLHAQIHLTPVSSGAGPLDAVVMRCLAKDPAARFANARELADAIEAATT